MLISIGLLASFLIPLAGINTPIPQLPQLPELRPEVLLAIETPEFPDRRKEAAEASKYVVEAGEALSTVAAEHGTTWERLWDANPQLSDPNVLQVGDKLEIPKPDEQLPDRPVPSPEPAQAPVELQAVEQTTPALQPPLVASNGVLVGSIGYARAGGNCVNEPGVNNPGWGNPSDWPVTSTVPWIGATAVWYSNHVGVVTGIWPDGSLEIRHQNFYGDQHRFPRSTFRGFR